MVRGSVGRSRPEVYCAVPRSLASELEPLLRRALRGTAAVVVEARRVERRRRDRRAGDGTPPPGGDRRKVRNQHGRRIAERRAPVAPATDIPALPAPALRHRETLVFFERLAPSPQRLADIATARAVVRAQSGDQRAMPELYLKHFDGVYGYLRVALRDDHEAEDAAQEVFLKALQALPRYELRPDAPFRAWLYRIARNELVSRLRKKRWVEVEDPEIVTRRADAAGSDCSATLTAVSNSDLMQLLERLPIAQRQVIALRYMLDLDTTDIAMVLDRAPDAVRQLEYRARRSLEERLEAVRARETNGRRRAPMLMRVRPAGVLRARRFALVTDGARAFSTRARHRL